MVSVPANEVAGAVTRLSAPTALPRSTVVTVTPAGAGAVSCIAGAAGSVVAGGGVVAMVSLAVSFCLQPARAMPVASVAAMAALRVEDFMVVSVGRVIRRGARGSGPVGSGVGGHGVGAPLHCGLLRRGVAAGSHRGR